MYPNDAIILYCHSMLLRDIQLGQNREENILHRKYSKNVLAWNLIFEILLGKFLKMVNINDKKSFKKQLQYKYLQLSTCSVKTKLL